MSALEAIQRQVMWNRLIAVVEEQAQTMIRTAFSTTVREAGDLSAGIFDLQGRMLAQAVTGTPGHVNSMMESVGHFLRRFPAETMGQGDHYITNDPWLVSGHLHDLTVFSPVFRKAGASSVGLFACTCASVIDIGGIGMGPDARSVFMRRGCTSADHAAGFGMAWCDPHLMTFFDILRAGTSALPDEVEGDILLATSRPMQFDAGIGRLNQTARRVRRLMMPGGAGRTTSSRTSEAPRHAGRRSPRLPHAAPGRTDMRHRRLRGKPVDPGARTHDDRRRRTRSLVDLDGDVRPVQPARHQPSVMNYTQRLCQLRRHAPRSGPHIPNNEGLAGADPRDVITGGLHPERPAALPGVGPARGRPAAAGPGDGLPAPGRAGPGHRRRIVLPVEPAVAGRRRGQRPGAAEPPGAAGFRDHHLQLRRHRRTARPGRSGRHRLPPPACAPCRSRRPKPPPPS